ncbi:YhcH/YjgK/YiaL family protein [Candidatus Clostridium radicumherbarum]|uniref:YhcH/YjgK/YiaL family protein n=1 Tax=Candidatus Clostridium radicumherbarum TaxID=3381662 RepID=A0ABW8TTS8_9CLOT
MKKVKVKEVIELIFANIKDVQRYENLNINFIKAFKFLNREGLNELLPGKYEIDGDHVYALVQEYETKELDNVKYEAHQKYIDIQYMVYGQEMVGYCNIDNLTTSTPYNRESDYILLDGDGEMLLLRSKEFFVFFPEDAHLPGIKAAEKLKVKKVVIKVRI